MSYSLSPSTGKRFSSLENVQIISGAHPASYSMNTEGSFQRVKWLRE
jgi:hypothetical protein